MATQTVDPAGQYGGVVRETVIPARWYLAVELSKGQVLRIVDLEGQQVADVVFWNRRNLAEKLSPNNTVTLNRNIYLSNSGSLYSDQANVMCSIVAVTDRPH